MEAAAKCACTHATEVLSGYFSPRQVGIGVPGGCEAAVHAIRRFMEGMRGVYVVVKLDFSNAFNCLHRDFMLELVVEMVPRFYRFCHLEYSKHSSLQFGEFLVSSQVGSQQGNPLAGLLFCLAIHLTQLSLSSPLSIGFMDYITLCVIRFIVASDVELFKAGGSRIGLDLKVSKCESIHRSHDHPEQAFQGFLDIAPEDACLLGAPLCTGKSP